MVFDFVKLQSELECMAKKGYEPTENMQFRRTDDHIHMIRIVPECDVYPSENYGTIAYSAKRYRLKIYDLRLIDGAGRVCIAIGYVS